MLLGRIRVALGVEQPERGAEAGPRVAGLDDLVHVAAFGGDVGGRELLAVLPRLLLPEGRRVGHLLQLPPVENIHGAVGPHHRDLRGGVGEVGVAPDVL